MHLQYQRKESLQFIPGRMHQQDAVLDQAGTWLVQCRTTNHFDAGMDALLNVTAGPRESAALWELLAPGHTPPEAHPHSGGSHTPAVPLLSSRLIVLARYMESYTLA